VAGGQGSSESVDNRFQLVKPIEPVKDVLIGRLVG
jgi:hypothetical protein